uniref:C2 calcium-dependent domain-containing protein 4C n=1 Tax=Xenopus tropicalis TaxID=8364 RepID=A0A6I8SHI4_XENTR
MLELFFSSLKLQLTTREVIALRRQGPLSCPNVLTPDRIPEFCIPPRFPSQRALKMRSFHRSVPDLSGTESTNADPQSQAALSLPHLPKMQTSYGFCTLLESPNTRRKESLFHNDPASFPILLPRSRSNTTSSPSSFSLRLHPLSRSDSSPFNSPLLQRSLPRGSSLLKAISQDKLFSRAFKGKAKLELSRNNSLSTDEGSSTDSSPSMARRVSDGMMDSIFPMDLLCSRDRFVGDNAVFLDSGGSLRMSAEYCPTAQRLRVRLISAEGLYQSTADPKTINCFVTLSITPGKQQKQRSTVIRRSRNPIFNEDFFFENLSETQLRCHSLKLKAINKMFGMKRDWVLGQSELPLLSILCF